MSACPNLVASNMSSLSARRCILGGVPVITAVRGDITEQNVDAIVNAANEAMRGGGGVDGAIHRRGGPTILRECKLKFPHGLATGKAGWTTAGDLPARWVIHTVGPNYKAGQRDRAMLEACYRHALAVADELGARVVAFPLISTGAFGWPPQEAIATAVATIAAANTSVDEVQLVAFDAAMHEQVLAQLALWTPIRILQGVRVLHQRGYHRMRILPGVSPSGMYWRVAITTADNLIEDEDYPHIVDFAAMLAYSTGGLTQFAGYEVSVATKAETIADFILSALPGGAPTGADHTYVSWFADLLRLVESSGQLPIAYAEYFDARKGWEIGWGSGIRYPRPPRPADATPKKPVPSQPLPSMSDANQATTLKKLDAILRKATGLSSKISTVEGLLVPRGDPQFPGVTVKFTADAVRGADRATLFTDGAYVRLGVWPAELQTQYTYIYSDPARVDALLQLATHEGFTIQPNFQLAHRFAQPLQRWYPSRLLSAEDYVHQWIDDFHGGRAGGRTREQIADPHFFWWLVDRRYARDSEEDSLREWLNSKAAGIQIHVRPGIEIIRTWTYAEVFETDDPGEISAEVSKATNQILAALGRAGVGPHAVSDGPAPPALPR